MRQRWPPLLAFGLVTSSLPARAHTPDVPDHMLTLGPSLAYGHRPGVGSGLIYGLDAALTWTALWGGGGVRSFENGRASERELLPYLEAGLYLLFNVGGGYTFGADQTSYGVAGPHFFIGLPLPLPAFIRDQHDFYESLYVEPYYRSTYVADGTLHEAGLLLKGAIVLRE